MIAAACLPFVAGCAAGLVGAWKATAEAPLDAAFHVRQINFFDNGQYFALVRQREREITLNGTYAYDGFRLVLRTPGEGKRVLPASMRWGRELKITAEADRPQTLRKQ